MNHLLDSLRRQPALVITFVFFILGVAVLISTSKAATSSASIEPELGGVTGNASVATDQNASNGKAVSFNPPGTATQLPNPSGWTNATGNLASVPAECGLLTWVWPQPGTNRLIAGVAGTGLYSSDNFGTSWTIMGGLTTTDHAIWNRPSWVSFDPAHPGTFYESGTWHNDVGGVFKTTDNGATFQRLGSFQANGADYVSVNYSDANRQLLLAGPHEASHQVWKSTNGGSTWTDIGTGTWKHIDGSTANDVGFTDSPVIIDAQTYVVNAGGGGIYRTTDAGANWKQVSTLASEGYPALLTSKGVLYYYGSGELRRSADNGVTWTADGGDFRGSTPFELPDGRLIMIGHDHLYVSNAAGTSWTQFGPAMTSSYNDPSGWPPVGGTVYSPGNGAVYAWHWSCPNGYTTSNMLQDSILMLK